MAATPGTTPKRRGTVTVDDDWHWVGPHLSVEERSRKYPDRFVADTAPPGYNEPDSNKLPAHMVRALSIG